MRAPCLSRGSKRGFGRDSREVVVSRRGARRALDGLSCVELAWVLGFGGGADNMRFVLRIGS